MLLALAALAYAAYFSFLTITRYNAFESRALDMGNLNQAIWNTAHGNWFHLTNQPGIVNRLSLHVEPIIIPLAWLYRLWPDPRLLLVVQAVVVALGALPVFALGRHKLKSDWLALVFALIFLLHPSIQAANWLEFHPVALAPTFLLAAFFFLLTHRVGWFAFFALLAAGCKEEIALQIFMMGLYAFFFFKQRRLGLITMGLALAWALFAVLVVQNIFATGNIHWERYGYLGDSPSEIVRTMITQPGLVWAQLQAAHALRYLLLLLLPVAFTPLLALDLLLLALPSLAINLLADFPPMHQVDTLIYAAPIVPFVFISAIFGVSRLESRLAQGNGRPAMRVGRHKGNGRRLFHPLIGMALLGCALVAQWALGYLPGGGNYRLYAVTEHHRNAAAIIAQISPAAKVSAQDKLNPHVSGRETVYIFPRLDDADTLFLDVSGPAWPLHPNDVHAEVDRLLADGWGVIAAADGYLLLQKGSTEQRIPAAFYDRWRGDASQTVQATFGEQLILADYAVTTDAHDEIVTQLVLRAAQPIGDDLRLYIGYLDQTGAILHDTIFYPPVASLWYPTSMWPPEQNVVVDTLPWTLDTDRFTLVVGVYRGEDGWTQGDRLAVTANPASLPVTEAGTLVRLGGFQRVKSDEWHEISPSVASPAQPLAVEFDGQLALTGADLPPRSAQSGQELPFTLHWQALTTPALDYTVFAHLLNEQGDKVAQVDWQPADSLGPRPMTSWSPGEVIVDTQTLLLPAELPGGAYRLIVGVYDWQSGTRLPARGAQAKESDVVTVGTITVGH